MQRPKHFAPHHRMLGLAGFLPRVIETKVDERIEAGVSLLDPRDGCFDHLDGRELLRPYQPGDLGGGEIGECDVCHNPDSLEAICRHPKLMKI